MLTGAKVDLEHLGNMEGIKSGICFVVSLSHLQSVVHSRRDDERRGLLLSRPRRVVSAFLLPIINPCMCHTKTSGSSFLTIRISGVL